MPTQHLFGLLLVAPALALVAALFLYPLGLSIVSAFSHPDGGIGLANFAKALEFYSGDMLYTIFIVVTSTALTGLVAIAIAGYLTMGETLWLVTGLAWLYRWPLFIPFIVAAQCMRTFLAKNGMLNNTLGALGLVDVASLSGLLDWRGIIVTFVWKETPFVALLVSGAMAALDRAGIEAARNLGAGGLRILLDAVNKREQPVRTIRRGTPRLTAREQQVLCLIGAGHAARVRGAGQRRDSTRRRQGCIRGAHQRQAHGDQLRPQHEHRRESRRRVSRYREESRERRHRRAPLRRNDLAPASVAT